MNVSGGYLVGGAVGLQFMNCSVSDIVLTGTNTLAGMQGIGGLVGFGSSYDETAPAQITGCKVEDVEIAVSDSTESVGDPASAVSIDCDGGMEVDG